jgi:hypothetical protein
MAFFSISTLDANCERIPCIVSGPDMAVAKQSAPIPPPRPRVLPPKIYPPFCNKNVKKVGSACLILALLVQPQCVQQLPLQIDVCARQKLRELSCHFAPLAQRFPRKWFAALERRSRVHDDNAGPAESARNVGHFSSSVTVASCRARPSHPRGRSRSRWGCAASQRCNAGHSHTSARTSIFDVCVVSQWKHHKGVRQ